MKRILITLGGALALLLFTSPAFAVQELIQTGATTPIPFLLVDSATGQIGQTGQASNITVTVCKPGTTSYVASSGTITELGNGLYNYAPTTAETGSGTTEGFLLIHVTDTTDSAQLVDTTAQIVGFNPNSATNLGLSSLPTATPAASGGLPTVGTSTGQINPASGTFTGVGLAATQTGVTIPTVTTVTNSVVASSVTGAVGSIAGVTFPANFGTFSIDSSGRVTLIPADVPPTAAAIATASAADILTTPADLINTDGSGRVVLQPTETGVTIPTVTTVTNSVVASSVTGAVGSIAGVTFPANFGTFSIDSSGRVTLIPADVPPSAATIATASAADILLTPADLINTDGSGRVVLQPTETGVTIPTVTTVTNPMTVSGTVSLASTQTFNNTGQTTPIPSNVTQIAGQTANASAAVTFPGAIGTSTYAGADTSGTTTLLARIPTFPTNFNLLSIDTSGYTRLSTSDTTASTIANLTQGSAGTQKLTATALSLAPTGGSAPTTSQIAAAILKTPANLLATDSNGYTTFNNTSIPTVTSAVTLPANAPSTFDANETTTQAISTQVNKLTFDGSNYVKANVQTGSITTVTGNVAGSVGSVTSAVTLPTNAPSTFDANETVIGNVLSQTSAGNQQSNAATGVLGATASSFNTSGTIGYKINNVSGGGGSVTDSSVQTDVGTELNSLGYTTALATALGTTNTDVPLIYTKLGTPSGASVSADIAAISTLLTPTYPIAASLTTSNTGETLTAAQFKQLTNSVLNGQYTQTTTAGVTTVVYYLAGYPVKTANIVETSTVTPGVGTTRLIASPFPTGTP